MKCDSRCSLDSTEARRQALQTRNMEPETWPLMDPAPSQRVPYRFHSGVRAGGSATNPNPYPRAVSVLQVDAPGPAPGWVVSKIRVPFCYPYIVGARNILYIQKGLATLRTTRMSCSEELSGRSSNHEARLAFLLKTFWTPILSGSMLGIKGSIMLWGGICCIYVKGSSCLPRVMRATL